MPSPSSTWRAPLVRSEARSQNGSGAWAFALGLACLLPLSARADAAAPADPPPAAAPGPRIELPPDVEDSVAPVPPAAASPAPPSSTAPPAPSSPPSAAAAGSQPPPAVPVQSEFVLGDAPPQGSSVTLNLPRQSQIDVAIDPRTRALRGLAIGGYGEAVVNAPLDKSAPAVADLRRTILFLGFNFTDRIRFFSEIEFEHALTTDGKRGEVAVEQAILDFLFSRAINLRAGMILMPVGLINLYHEPSTFNGVERPDSDLLIIPSTWKQVGGGLFGAGDRQAGEAVAGGELALGAHAFGVLLAPAGLDGGAALAERGLELVEGGAVFGEGAVVGELLARAADRCQRDVGHTVGSQAGGQPGIDRVS